MSAPELTPLIRSRHLTPPLEVRAADLIAQGAGICLSPPSSEDLDITHEFASALYALHIVERHDKARGSARAAAYRASESARTRAALRDHALASLDAALEFVGTEATADDDDDVLVLSRPLPVKGRYTSVASLLSHHTTPGAVLAHPLIRASLPRAWSRSRRSRRLPSRGLRAILDNAVTPARAHLFELVATQVYVALTFVTALVPDIDVGPDTSGATTIIWIIWSWAMLTHGIVDAFTRRRGPSSTGHLVLMLPAELAGVLMPITTHWATLLRTISIPCCTLAIVLPSAPSFPFLFPSRLLPLSTMLAGILARGAKAAALLIPIGVLMWALFAYALNGDVWRAAPNAFEVAATIADAVPLSLDSPVHVLGGGTIEVGVAPFETRVALCVTLVLVLALSAGLSILRAMAPSNELHDGTWEAEYGPAIGHASRRALAAAVARYLPPTGDHAPPSIPVPVPLNFLILPYEFLAGMCAMFRREPPFGLRRVRGWVALLIVAVPCAVISPLAVFLPRW